MELFCWILAAMLVIGILSTIASVGKPRRPVTGPAAAVMALFNAGWATGLVLIATGVLR